MNFCQTSHCFNYFITYIKKKKKQLTEFNPNHSYKIFLPVVIKHLKQ